MMYHITPSLCLLSHQDRGHGSQENGVTAEESEKLLGRREDFPLQPGQ
jgi:hypothetical protein